MENKKDIGKAFKEKLNSLDRVPGDHVWIGISDAIEKDKKGKSGLFFFWGATLFLLVIGAIALLNQYDQNDGLGINTPKKATENTIIYNSKVKTTNNSLSDSTNSENKSNETVSNKSTGTKTNKSNETTADKNSETSTNRSNATTANKNDLLKNKKATISKIRSNTKNNIGQVNASKKAKLTNSTNVSVLSSSSQKSKRTKFASTSGKNKMNSLSDLKNKNTGRKWFKKSRNKPEKEESSSIVAKTDATQTEEKATDLNPLKVNDIVNSGSELKNKATDSIAEKDKTITIFMHPEDSIKEDSLDVNKKFYVDIFASPTLYGYFSTAGVFDNRLNSLSKKSDIKWSYGLGITYDSSEKISFRFGISKINLSHTILNASIDGTNYNSIVYDAFVSNQTILKASNAMATNKNEPARMNITHEISYIEIPVAIKYKFLDREIGMKSSLGFSYLLRYDDKVIIKTNSGYQQDIGKMKNLSTTSFSINAGLELDYSVFENAKIFMEPMLNYPLKAFSESVAKPYVFGLHLGVRYSFNN
jgi:hypothetical protein